MAVSFRLYTYTHDNGISAVSNVVVPEIVTLSEIEETIEREGGGFRLGNVSAVVRGVPDGYFARATDPNAPVVFEMSRDGVPLWHGPVEAESVKWDASTFRTSFTARSWEAVLADAQTLPARSVYEVTARGTVEGTTIPPYLPQLGIVVFGTVPVAVGDIVTADGPQGDLREPVLAVRDQTDTFGLSYRVIEIAPPPPRAVFESRPKGGSDRLRGDEAELRFSGAPAETLRAAMPDNGVRGGNAAWVPGGGQTAELILRSPTGIQQVVRVREVVYTNSGDSVVATLKTSGGVSSLQWANTTQFDLRTNAPISRNLNLKILGRDVYGYVPTDPNESEYDIQGIIEAMMFVGENNSPTQSEGRPLGVLPSVVRSVNWFGVPSRPTVSAGVELPEKPIDALRLLQNTGGFFARFVPRFAQVGRQTVPRVDIELVNRSVIETDAPLAAPVSVVRAWTEDGADNDVRAVVVKPNAPYRKPNTNRDYAGVWFVNDEGETPDSIAALPNGLARLRYMGVPSGSNVVTVDVAMTPAWDGDYAFGGASRQTVNDDALKLVARRLWDYYSSGSRRATITLALDADGSDFVGRRVSFNEAGLARTLFVTKRSVSFEEGALSAKLEGIIDAEYVTGAPLPPRALISGALGVSDGDGDGQAAVSLSGSRSYSPTGGALTFKWHRKPLGGGAWVLVGNEMALEDTVTVAPGTTAVFEYRLTVVGDAGSAEATAQVVVSEVEAAPAAANPREYTDIQFAENGNGVVQFYPAVPEAVERVFVRTVSGGELPEIVWSNPPNPAAHYPGVLTAPSGSDGRGPFYRAEVPLAIDRISYAEMYVEFEPELGLEPLIVRWTFDANTRPDIRDLVLAQDANGNVLMSVRADEDTDEILWEVLGGGAAGVVSGNAADDVLVASGVEPGDSVTVQATPRTAGGAVNGPAWTRTLVYTFPATPTPSTEGETFTFTPREVQGAPNITGTLLFDQDGGDGAGNRRGLQVRHTDGYATVWDAANDGAGSGLDADRLDGFEAVEFTRKSQNESIAGYWSFAGGLEVVGGSFLVDESAAQATILPALRLGRQATDAGHALRADRLLSGATFQGFGLLVAGAASADLTADRALTVVPPQDLRVSAYPQFAGGTFTGAVNVYADEPNNNSAHINLYGILAADGRSGYGLGMGPTAAVGFTDLRGGHANVAFQGVRFLTNGQEAGRINGLGRFGLGVDPAYRLDVGASDRADATPGASALFRGAVYSRSEGVLFGTEAFQSGFGGSGLRLGRRTLGDGSVRHGIEADELTIRGTFSVYEILAREISAVNGNLFISAQNEVETFESVVVGGSPQQTPTAAPSAAFTYTVSGRTVTITPTGGPASGRTITSRLVDLGTGDQPEPVGAGVQQVAYGQDGQFILRYTVIDDAGGESVHAAQVSVQAGVAGGGTVATAAPAAVFSYTINERFVIADTLPTFAPGRAFAYSVLDWGDGTSEDPGPGYADNYAHEYAADGQYTITYTVTDDAGGTSTYAVQVTAQAAVPGTPAVPGYRDFSAPPVGFVPPDVETPFERAGATLPVAVAVVPDGTGTQKGLRFDGNNNQFGLSILGSTFAAEQEHVWRVYFTASPDISLSWSGSDDGSYLRNQATLRNGVLDLRVNDNVVASGSPGVTGAGWYRVRTQTHPDGVRAKVWPDGQAEPTAWTAASTNTTHKAGRLYVETYRAQCYIHWIGSAQNGAAVPTTPGSSGTAGTPGASGGGAASFQSSAPGSVSAGGGTPPASGSGASVLVGAEGGSVTVITGGGAGHRVTVKGRAKLTVGSFVIGQMLSEDYTSLTLYRGQVTATTPGNPGSVTLAQIEGTPRAGMTLARYDHATDPEQRGYIYVATSDTGAPFQAVRVGNGSGKWPPPGGNETVRLGKLTGLNPFAGETGTLAHGLAVGSVGNGGWASFRASRPNGTGGVEFWQGASRVGYVSQTGIRIGDQTSYLHFDALGESFDLVLGGSPVLTAASAPGVLDGLYTTLAAGQATDANVSSLALSVGNLESRAVLSVNGQGGLAFLDLASGAFGNRAVLSADSIDLVGITTFLSRADVFSPPLDAVAWTAVPSREIAVGLAPPPLGTGPHAARASSAFRADAPTGYRITIEQPGTSLLSAALMPLSARQRYRLRVRLRSTGGQQVASYVGLCLAQRDGSPWSGIPLREGLGGALTLPTDEWVEVEREYGGSHFGADSIGVGTAETAPYARIWIACNLDTPGTPAEIEVDSASLTPLVEAGALGATVIDGGRIRTDLLDVGAIFAQNISVSGSLRTNTATPDSGVGAYIGADGWRLAASAPVGGVDFLQSGGGQGLLARLSRLDIYVRDGDQNGQFALSSGVDGDGLAGGRLAFGEATDTGFGARGIWLGADENGARFSAVESVNRFFKLGGGLIEMRQDNAFMGATTGWLGAPGTFAWGPGGAVAGGWSLATNRLERTWVEGNVRYRMQIGQFSTGPAAQGIRIESRSNAGGITDAAYQEILRIDGTNSLGGTISVSTGQGLGEGAGVQLLGGGNILFGPRYEPAVLSNQQSTTQVVNSGGTIIGSVLWPRAIGSEW